MVGSRACGLFVYSRLALGCDWAAAENSRSAAQMMDDLMYGVGRGRWTVQRLKTTTDPGSNGAKTDFGAR